MDFSYKAGSDSKHLGVCRCCLKEDGLRDICAESVDLGATGKSYEEMLKSTFSIEISQLKSEVKERLICNNCISSLRDAYTFKQMVLRSEETFLEYLLSLECDDGDTNPLESELKKPEAIKVEESTDDERTTTFGSSCQDDDDDCLDEDKILENLKHELTKSEGSAILNRRKRKGSRDKCKKRCKIKENNDILSNSLPEKDWSKITERRGSGPLLRANSLKLIQNSNLCVFQWNKSRYRCFCCKEPFSDINLLKQHTFNSHTLENIERKIILQQNRLVKVEISGLNCKLCREKLEDVTSLKQHLSRTHSIDTSEDLLVPFKIESELKCQICFEKFSVFRLLNIHMNRHFQKHVCHICGSGFSNSVFLNLHRNRSHRPFDCKRCNLTFNNKTDKKKHDTAVHNVKVERKLRFPCPFCPERFFQEDLRVRHLVENHGMEKPDFRCEVCSKTFLTRSLANNHVKNVHNKEKNQECDVCHHFFYSKSDVTRHKVTHTGEKKYSCEICNNPFATKDSLRRHMKRTHVDGN